MEILNIAYGVFMFGIFSLVIYELMRKRDHRIVNSPKIKIYTTSKKSVFVQEDSEDSNSSSSDDNCEDEEVDSEEFDSCKNNENENECEDKENCDCECENNENDFEDLEE